MQQSTQTTSGQNNSNQNNSGNEFAIKAPDLSLPKGGGSLHGMGEKFAANPVTGTGSFSIPITVTKSRNDFGPKLTLSYDSGAGNGPFGMGWNLSLPQITRKTDKGLPLYQDGRGEQPDSDVFLLSDAEDLVPELMQTPDGQQKIASYKRMADGKAYEIRRYKPRVESSFSRIERWANLDEPGDMFWRSFSKDNILAIYGKDTNSRIADPLNPERIFNWLICEVRDDKGEAILYEYNQEDGAGLDLSLASEANRGDARDLRRTANRYLKRVLYGNKQPLLDENAIRPPFLSQSQKDSTQWLFEVVLDYGEYDPELIQPEGGEILERRAWQLRPDPFSSYRSGFEVRTCRLCRRILMFHHIPDDLVNQNGYDGLVHTIDFTYSGHKKDSKVLDPSYSFLAATCQTYYKKTVDKKYILRLSPPVEFTYSQPVVQDAVETVDPESLKNLPIGLDENLYQWIDLHGEGAPGILTQQGGAWLYKSNLSPLGDKTTFAPAKMMAVQPNILPGAQTQLLDLAGDGRLDFVVTDGAGAGFFKHDDAEGWQEFRPFSSWLHHDMSDPNLRLIDLDGDGHADILITEQDVFLWYPSLAEEGFDSVRRVFQPKDEELGPRLVFADSAETIFLSDMNGDGLTDLIRIRNGEICYWPNAGYGRFGAKVTMDNSPWFDHEDQFDAKRIRLADIDGSGTTDIIYLHRDGVRLYFNCFGNGWTLPKAVKIFPQVDNLGSISVLDLLGNGTACLVWSSPLPGDAHCPMRYINLMGQKPHLLVKIDNHLGGETRIEYASSTKFYLQDKLNGKPWVTKLPFPVHVVTKTEILDKWRNTRFSSSYSYHHGYFDGAEREFRGFGRVEQVDVEDFGQFSGNNSASPYITGDNTLYQPPVKTISWYHVGAFLDGDRIFTQFMDEYFPKSIEGQPGGPKIVSGFRENRFPEPELEGGEFTAEEWREALRACKGMPLRKEVYELDAAALSEGRRLPVKLFTAQEHNYCIKRLQARAANRHAVFLVAESENIAYHYELDLRSPELCPDPRIVHTLNLQMDQYANVLQSVSAAYPRLGRLRDDAHLAGGLETAWQEIEEIQQETYLAYTEARYTGDYHESDEPASDQFRLRDACETLTYELTGFSPQSDGYFSLHALRAHRLSMVHQPFGSVVVEIPYHHLPNHDKPQKRLVEHTRILYFNDENQSLSEPLPLGMLGRLGLTFETYKLALTDELLAAIFGTGAEDKLNLPLGPAGSARQMLSDCKISGYLSAAELESRFPGISGGQYWMRSGTAGFSTGAGQRFFLPDRYTDPFGEETLLAYEPCCLMMQSSTDPAGNKTSAVRYDYRCLLPCEMKDCNNNLMEVAINLLGQVAALAMKGKGGQGDNLEGFNDSTCNLDTSELRSFFAGDDYSADKASKLLGNATSRYIYYWGEAVSEDLSIIWGVHPPSACSLSREKHCAQEEKGVMPEIQAAFAYSDGAGTEIVQKLQAEPPSGSAQYRWLTSGKTICNNKGNPVKQYEPYFSDHSVGRRFEEPKEVGVTSVLYYDAVDRNFRTDMPDGTFTCIEFSPWHTASYDANDTVLRSSWFAEQSGQRAAFLAARHADTPAVTVLDSLGREVFSVAHNVYQADDDSLVHEKYLTYTKLDAEGKPLWIRDARGNLAMQYIRSGTPAYDISGNILFQHGMDEGDRWTLCDAAGNVMAIWDGNAGDGTEMPPEQKRVFFTVYDALRRPVEHWLIEGSGSAQMVERLVYGEKAEMAEAHNLRGNSYQYFDQSGAITFAAYDFKGNLLEQRRQLTEEYKETVDWKEGSKTAALEKEVFVQNMEYDALNRVSRLFHWHKDTGGKAAVYEPAYNKRGFLESAVLWNGDEKTIPVVSITYDAKGQRESLIYGNNSVTRYDYDPLTFRLRQLRTTRPGYDPGFPGNPAPLKNDHILQDLHYFYDPVGNITEICDNAFETAYFKNQQVEPRSLFVYDALYRLVSATGREDMPTAHEAPGHFEQNVSMASFPVEIKVLSNYLQRYSYDAAGNMTEMRHHSGTGSWTRKYEYAAGSNHLTISRCGAADDIKYRYDSRGNMLNPGDAIESFDLCWNFQDMISCCNRGGGGWVYYNYDSGKTRIRKVSESQTGAKRWERIYLDGLEVYRKYSGDEVVEEIETLHLMDGDKRFLMIEDVIKTDNSRLSCGVLLRYQYDNHLGSAALELDDTARIISYEEYHPFGTSAYRAMSKDIKAAANRYRYTGKERDEESGLYYHGARYYAPWICRWVSCDPVGLSVNNYRSRKEEEENEGNTNGGNGDDASIGASMQSSNLYIYCMNNPVRYFDPSGGDAEDVTRTIARWASKPLGVATRNDWFKSAFYEAGFIRTRDLKGRSVYHARMDCLQQYGGYNNFYDTVFYYATSMAKDKFQFTSGGVDYMLWAWKGDYLNLGAGAELGVYKRFEIPEIKADASLEVAGAKASVSLETTGMKTDHWLVDQSLSMHMTLSLFYKGQEIIKWDPAKDTAYPSDKVWWVTGFNPDFTEVDAKHLTAIYTVTFNTKQMYEDFYKTWKEDIRWSFDPTTNTARFVF